jgi:16S rRNA (adenine1518-N6/adenine1519-N6)-dimethyltransferase
MTRRKDVTDLGCNPQLFKTVVKTTFGQRRKTLRNSLKSLLPPGASLPADEPMMTLRPEQLSVQQFINLTNLVDDLRSQQQ